MIIAKVAKSKSIPEKPLIQVTLVNDEKVFSTNVRK